MTVANLMTVERAAATLRDLQDQRAAAEQRKMELENRPRDDRRARNGFAV